jgi:hypothetical protein
MSLEQEQSPSLEADIYSSGYKISAIWRLFDHAHKSPPMVASLMHMNHVSHPPPQL